MPSHTKAERKELKESVRSLSDPSKIIGFMAALRKARDRAEDEIEEMLGFKVKKKPNRIRTVGE